MEAYIYDAVRAPRGRGKADGSLHEITPIQLATQVLEAVRDRNAIDTADVDMIVEQMELDRDRAERTLREHKGDVVAALNALVTAA